MQADIDKYQRNGGNMVKAIVGANWGDEGKGKITDMLAEESDIIVRFQGGSNAGHTIINEYGKFALHLLPSGVFYNHTTSIIGNGVALNIPYLIKELKSLTDRNVPMPKILVSDRAQILMPYHVDFDTYEEARLAGKSFGSTKSGIAPFYSDKYAKIGFQVCELFGNEDELKDKIANVCTLKNVMLEHLYHKPLLNPDEIFNTLMEYKEMIAPYVTDTSAYLNKALKDLLNEEIAVIGASRTDSGVHAMGNVAVFDTETRIPAEKISFALNQRLPNDIRIQKSDEVPLDWHPRYRDSTKTYEYKILNRRFPDPLQRFYTHFMYMPLDEQKMKEAAEYIVGEHDFASFCSAGSQVESTVRTVYSLSVNKRDDVISIRITGNGFLYNMVRIIVGTLIKVGLGVYPPEHVKEIIEAKDRYVAGPKAPACGLTLVGIEYSE